MRALRWCLCLAGAVLAVAGVWLSVYSFKAWGTAGRSLNQAVYVTECAGARAEETPQCAALLAEIDGAGALVWTGGVTLTDKDLLLAMADAGFAGAGSVLAFGGTLLAVAALLITLGLGLVSKDRARPADVRPGGPPPHGQPYSFPGA